MNIRDRSSHDAHGGAVECGLDNLQGGNTPEIHSLLAGCKIGLLTNHTGRTRNNRTTQDTLEGLGLNVVALYTPEHGPTGTREGDIESGKTAAGLPVHSLYGESRRPSSNVLADIDVFVCDIQDVGARFYTYATTLAYCMEACAEHGIPVVVLDRPNPLGGELIEGPLVDEEQRSFVGYLRIPIRHGLTLGELAQWHRRDAGLDLDLRIVPVAAWMRDMSWPSTGLQWPVPSPNLPHYESAAWYPGACLLEFSGVAVGRGTETPFQIVGAPWFEPSRVLRDMEAWPDAVREQFTAEAVKFTPTRAIFETELCHGLRFRTPDSGVPANPVSLGLALLSSLHRTHPAEFGDDKLQAALQLLGSVAVLEMLRGGDIAGAVELAELDAARFRAERQGILMY